MMMLIHILLLAAQLQPGPAIVEGVVKNQKTGAPLADVRVTLATEAVGAGTGAASATTDAGGRFIISVPNPGRYSINASRTLFFQPRRAAGARQLTIASEARLRDVEIFLMPTAVIAGRILDSNRAPLRSVRVEALRREYRDGNQIFVMAAQNTTDDRGEYRLFNLQPGTYIVRATQGSIASQFVMGYYPGVADPQNASEIRLDAGDETSAIDLTLRPGTEFWAQLRLGGMPPGSATPTFYLQRRNSRVLDAVQTRPEALPDSVWRLTRLNPGSYDLFVRLMPTPTQGPPAQPDQMAYMARIPLDIVGDNVDLGTIGLQPSHRVQGTLVAPEALPTPVDLQRIAITLRPLNLPPVFAVAARYNAPTGNTIAPDGTFNISVPGTGRYQIAISGMPSGTYLTAARLGPRELLDLTLEVTDNAESLALVLGGPASVGALDGSVTNARGDAVPYSTVVLVPSPDRRSHLSAYRVMTSDQSGVFAIRGILPGDYKLLAWEEVETNAWQNSDFLKPFENRGETIRIQPGVTHSAAVRVIPAQE